jgi:hypothetical protein
VSPFADMPTHALNDLNAALWIVFFTAFVITSNVAALAAPRRRRRRIR